MNVKTQVEQAWASLSTVYPLSEDPPVFARVQPSRVVFQPLDFNRPDAVTVGLGLVARVDTFVGRKPAAPAPVPVPPIESRAEMPAKTMLRVPVVVDLDTVNEQLRRQLTSVPIDVHKGRKLSITSARVQNRGPRALLTIGYEVERSWYMFDVSGTVQITARPVLDSRRQVLAFKDLDYTVESKSSLLNAAAWLLKPVVLRVIEDRASVDLNPHLRKARAAANAQAQLLKRKLSPDSQLSMDDLRVQGIVLSRGLMIAVVESELSTHINMAAVK